MARRISEVYRLDVGVVLVTFLPNLGSPGRVELHGGRDFFVELDLSLRDHSRNLAATLGHEIAHIFLENNGLAFESTAETECLTDTAAALYGFGALMADTYVVTSTSKAVPGGTQITHHARSMGYLTPDEFGYVMTRSGTPVPPDALTSPAASVAFGAGRRRALASVGAPPLRVASRWRRLGYRLRLLHHRLFPREEELRTDRDYAFQAGGRVAFRCPLCTQGMRVPSRRSLNATCPCCGSVWALRS